MALLPLRRMLTTAYLSLTLMGALTLAACENLPGTASTVPSTNSATPVPASSGAAAVQAQFVAVVKKVGPSVVLVQTDRGLGSGIVFDTQGDVVTNYHVVQGAQSLKVSLANGKQYDGSLKGTFPPDDLAVVRIQASGLHPASFGDSSKLVVGDLVMAIGNPLGLQSSVTEGIVSAVGRTVSEPGGAALPGVIQTSAAINPGNSGGALVDLSGQVIGIPTLAATDPQIGGTAPGIGFAIPSNLAKDIATQLIQNGRVTNSHRAYMGIQAADTGGQGTLVYSVVSGGPADRGGIQQGDVITAINHQSTPDADALSTVLANLKPGDRVPVDIMREDGSRKTVTVTLGQFPG